MSAQLTISTGQEALETEFRVTGGADATTVLTLVEVRDLTTPATVPVEGARTPFSLLFRAPKEFRIRQATLEMQHEDLGGLEIFVVIVGEDEHGLYYEAIFN